MSDKKFISAFPRPTPRQAEIMECLIEETAEIMAECVAVQQRATKLMRFGIGEVQPGQSFTNAERLSMELGDLLEVLDMAVATKLVIPEFVDKGRERKRKQLAKFLQTEDDPKGARSL